MVIFNGKISGSVPPQLIRIDLMEPVAQMEPPSFPRLQSFFRLPHFIIITTEIEKHFLTGMNISEHEETALRGTAEGETAEDIDGDSQIWKRGLPRYLVISNTIITF